MISPTAGGERVVDEDQIVVRIERQVIGIERTEADARRLCERFGKGSGDDEERAGGGKMAKEMAAGVHGSGGNV
ncbi:MAG: hypothetical protein WDN28_15250 [Chthoniobacter sp.]